MRDRNTSSIPFAYPAPKTFPAPYFTDETTSLQILAKMFSAVSPRGFLSNSSRRFASVEIEVANYDNGAELNKALEAWNCVVVRDGSITGARPFEINTTPACGDSLRVQLSDICSGLLAANASVDSSCGLHVHIDCRDFGYQEVQRAVAVYAQIEHLLFESLHASRQDNSFCRPCGEYYYTGIIEKIKHGEKPLGTKTLKNATIEVVYGPQATKDYQRVYLRSKADHYGRVRGDRNEVRYAALNLHSYFLRGTVEFRLHHGAVDFNEIYGWVKMLLELFDSIKNTPYSKLNKMLECSSDEYLLQQLISKESFTYFTNKLALGEWLRKNQPIDTDSGHTMLPAQLMRNYRQKKTPALNVGENLEII